MGSFRNLTGTRFERLVVVRATPERKSGGVTWLCLCDCGKEKLIKGASLISGSTRSCGCLAVEKTTQRCKDGAVHGMSKDPVYNTWATMRARCENPKNPSFRKYGAKGIWVCGYLDQSPRSIVEIVGERPPGKSIDRIDGKLGYTCGRCQDCVDHGWVLNIRWATPKEQGRNTSSNRIIEIGGVSKCVSEWAETVGIWPSVILYRLKKGVKGFALLENNPSRSELVPNQITE